LYLFSLSQYAAGNIQVGHTTICCGVISGVSFSGKGVYTPHVGLDKSLPETFELMGASGRTAPPKSRCRLLQTVLHCFNLQADRSLPAAFYNQTWLLFRTDDAGRAVS